MSATYDVVVVGAGNAALAAAVAAAEKGASVLVLERAPKGQRGGNSAFTQAAYRVAYDGLADMRRIVPDLSEDEIAVSDFGTYTTDQYFEEWTKQSHYRCDMDVVQTVVDDSLDTMLWMQSHGVRFVPIYGRQAFKVDGKFRFWGGLTVEASGGGIGVIDRMMERVEALGGHVRYGARALHLERRAGGGWGVEVQHEGAAQTIDARSVVLASGGFHANLEWRSRYLGPGWDLAKVRGSRFNTGDGIRMAMEVGAIPHGNWTGCHGVFYDLNAPPFGDIHLLNQQKNYFTWGIVVNAEGQRFFDEGADFRNYIYSRMGAKVLTQPGAVAWQVFDQRGVALLPDEYRVRHATRLESPTLEGLAKLMEGCDAAAFLRTVGEFNAAVKREVPFNPAQKDGRTTQGLAIEKSNWAMPIEQGPFVAYAVTCGITCTYGGLKVNTDAQVIDEDEQPIEGLYATGELVGGLYYVNYAGGAGLMAGAVLGRIAGRHAAARHN